MKTLIRLGLVLILLAPLLTRAQTLIYKGSAKDAYTGQGHSQKISSKMFLIVDVSADPASATVLIYATVNGVKRYSSSDVTNLHHINVSAPAGKGISLLTRSPNECDINEGNTSDGIFAKGPTTGLLYTSKGAAVGFAKTLAGAGKSLFYSSGDPIIHEGSFTTSFNKVETVKSNDANETLDQALARLTAYVESLGYSTSSLTSEEKTPANLGNWF